MLILVFPVCIGILLQATSFNLPYQSDYIEDMKKGVGLTHIGLVARKSVFGGLPTTKAQTSLCIRAVLSAPLVFIYWRAAYLGLLRAKFQFSS